MCSSLRQRLTRAIDLEGKGERVFVELMENTPPTGVHRARTVIPFLVSVPVSKEAADVVLTDDNFASIAAAVEEGRRVYDNLVKSLAFVLPTNLGLALILLCAVAAFPFDAETDGLLLPIAPTQLLWINLVATVALALPLAFEAREPDVMRRPPRKPNEPILSAFVLARTAVVAVIMTAGAVGMFMYEYSRALEAALPATVALAEAQTAAVTTVIMFQIFYLLHCRSLRGSLFETGVFSNLTIPAGIAVILALQAAFIYLPAAHTVFGSAPLSLRDIAVSALVAALVLPIISIEKALRRKRSSQRVRP